MISNQNKDLFINKIRLGYTIIEACESAGINKRTLYRLFKAEPNFRTIFDETVAWTNKKIDDAQEKARIRKFEELKKIVLRKGR